MTSTKISGFLVFFLSQWRCLFLPFIHFPSWTQCAAMVWCKMNLKILNIIIIVKYHPYNNNNI